DAVVVAMRHDHGSDHSGAHPPTGSPAKLFLTFPVLEVNVAGPREVLTEKMRCPGLDRLPILNHRFNRERLHGTGESFAFRVFSGVNRDCAMIPNEGLVNVQHSAGFFARFRFAFMDGVTLLP